MMLRFLNDEDCTNYKVTSMMIGFPYCTFKCGREFCHNIELVDMLPPISYDVDKIVQRYLNNPLTSALILSGLEPFDSYTDLFDLISAFRKKSTDTIVIYSGYDEVEIRNKIIQLQQYTNIVVKFGRYIPGHNKHYDKELGVYLASDNQYGVRIS